MTKELSMTEIAENTGRCPVVHFDHNSAEHSADPVASYRKLRSEAPVAWSDAHGGYWVLSGYKPVFEAARDDEVFSSERNSYGGEGLSVVIPKTPAPFHIPIEIDPPEFRKWRKLINPSPRRRPSTAWSGSSSTSSPSSSTTSSSSARPT